MTLNLEFGTHMTTEKLETWVETDPLKNVLAGWNYAHDTYLSLKKYLKARLVKVEVSWVGRPMVPVVTSSNFLEDQHSSSSAEYDYLDSP